MNSTTDTHLGHAGWRWSLPNGDSVFVAEQGAHVLSWQAGGRERLYLSPASVPDGSTAIRGGIPVCFPQFNQRGTLPKHGFARNLPWAYVHQRSNATEKVFELVSNPRTLALWPVQFKAVLTVAFAAGSLKVQLAVENLGAHSFNFTGALHTYFAVTDIGQASVHGQAQQAEWDTVIDTHQVCTGHLSFNAEFDRVYDVNTDTQPTWTLQDAAEKLRITQSGSWGQSVVWNPGAAKCRQISDMPADGYQHMVCVEAARVTSPIEVQPAQTWVGWQLLTV